MDANEQRARELLADQYEAARLYETADGLRAGLEIDEHGKLALRAIRQALAQQVSADGELSADDRAVLQRLKNALPDVGLNGWIRGVAVLDKILAATPQAPQPVVDVTLDDVDDATILQAVLIAWGGNSPRESRALANAIAALSQPQQGAVPESIEAYRVQQWLIQEHDVVVHVDAVARAMATPFDDEPELGLSTIGQQAVDRPSPECSSLCAGGEPCAITQDGKCDAACDKTIDRMQEIRCGKGG